MFFGRSLTQLVESHFFLGEQFPLEPRFDRDDTISNASLSLYIIFISEAHCFEDKKPLVYLTFSFFIAASFQIRSLLSKIELKSPGERMLKWRHVITVPYQWLTEACVPRPVTTLSLSLPGPVGSTTPRHHSTVDTSREKLKVSQEGSSSKIPLQPLTRAQYRKTTAGGARERKRFTPELPESPCCVKRGYNSLSSRRKGKRRQVRYSGLGNVNESKQEEALRAMAGALGHLVSNTRQKIF